MGELIIIGASAMGREVYGYACDSGMKVKGFLDSRQRILDDFHGYPPILCSVEDYCPEKDDVFVCAVGDPLIRNKYVGMLSEKKGCFVSVIHPSAYIGMNVEIGCGSIICPNVSVTNDAKIGRYVILNLNVSVSHDCSIGDYSTICPGCHLTGRVKLGQNVFVGTGTVMAPDVELGDKVFVAAGAVVTRSFSHGRIMGIPAVLK